jgi:ribosomal protein S18 acetylase RimI-like enzyme
MPSIDIQVSRLQAREEAETCAMMMADSEPWISLQRGYQESLDIITESSREVYLAWQNGEIAGFIIVEMFGTFKGYIKSVCVSPNNRGHGIGSALTKYAEDRIFSETPNVFLLVSSFNHKARRFYEKLGYQEIGEILDFIISGYSEILMRKTIGPLSEFSRQ